MRDPHLALHGLAVRKHGDAAAVAGVVGVPEADIRSTLKEAVEKGRAVATGDGYMLSPAGRVALAGTYSKVYAAQRSDAAFVSACDRFEAVNREIKALMTAWQTVEIGGEAIANDHGDKDYDSGLIARLGDLHERAEGVFRQLAAGLPRLALYGERLEAALDKAEDGEIDWVSGAQIDSYHTVWFELHEDLLRVLGRTREE